MALEHNIICSVSLGFGNTLFYLIVNTQNFAEMKPHNNPRISLAIIATIFSFFLFGQSSDVNNSLEGSWSLTQFVPHSEGLTKWTSYGDSIIYQKHLSNDHFIWFKYDQKNNQLLGMGGGSYEIKEGKYIEDIKFFYPPGSNERGQAIPFDFNFSDGLWNHTGYSKVMDLDENSGDLIVIDSNKIEEKWVKTSEESNLSDNLQGIWELVAYRQQPGDAYIEYPEYAGYLKLITPTHFIWVYYNKNDDQVYAAGSGTYSISQMLYSENIKMIYPENNGELGATIDFSVDFQNDHWRHLGKIDLVITDQTGNKSKNSSLIDEIWKPHRD